MVDDVYDFERNFSLFFVWVFKVRSQLALERQDTSPTCNTTTKLIYQRKFLEVNPGQIMNIHSLLLLRKRMTFIRDKGIVVAQVRRLPVRRQSRAKD